jgi:hypothetical protein
MEEKSKISKENPFRVPENYFEGLTDRIVGASVQPKPQKGSNHVIRVLKPFLLAAASVAVLTAVGLTVLHYSTKKSSRDIGTEAFAANISARDLSEIDITTLEDSVAVGDDAIALPDVSRNEIIDYLAAEEISILDIYEQL